MAFSVSMVSDLRRAPTFNGGVGVEEVPMHKKCHNKKSFLSVALGLHRNISIKNCQKQRIFLSAALGLHRNYLCKEVSQKENFLFCGTFRSYALPLYPFALPDLI